MRIEPVNAYLVDNKLMSEKDVNTMIDNLIGKSVDRISEGGLFSGVEKLRLFDRLKAEIPHLVAVYGVIEAFKDAKFEKDR